MDIFHIEGPVRLSGSVAVNGSKNASLPIMAAAVLAPGITTLKSVPHLSDIKLFSKLLIDLGCTVSRNANGDMIIDAGCLQ